MDNKLPLGLRKPWQWEQPRDDDELLARLRDGFMLAVHERERENLCSVAHGRIKAMREEIALQKQHIKICKTTHDEQREEIALLTGQLPPLTDVMYHAVRGLELEFTSGGPEAVRGSIDDGTLEWIWEAINTALRVSK